MRDIALVMGLFILIPMIFKRPYVGALVWTWIAISSLHREAYGFSSALDRGCDPYCLYSLD